MKNKIQGGIAYKKNILLLQEITIRYTCIKGNYAKYTHSKNT